MRKVRFGIIGLGTQGRLYFDLLLGLPWKGETMLPPGPEHGVLTAISTRNEEVLHEALQQAPGVKGYTDWRRMIEEKACDAVVITTPHLYHTEIAIFAMEHGISVLCDKPVAVCADETEQIAQIAHEHPELSYGVMFQQRCNPVFQHLYQVIHSGELGELRRLTWVLDSWWRPDDYYRRVPWRASWNLNGGGLLTNQAPHQIDLWLWLCGRPEKVYAICREGAYRDITIENDATILAQYESGATAVFTTCTHNIMGTDELQINFSKGQVIVRDGEAIIRRFHEDESYYNQTMDVGEPERRIRTDPDSMFREERLRFPHVFAGDYPVLFENYARHILYGEPLAAPGEECAWSVAMANTAMLSAWKGEQVTYPCDPVEYRKWFEKRKEEENPALLAQ